MEITIEINSSTAVYQQIVQQIQEAVITGNLSAGAFLPSIRQLATGLEINPNTVAKAYQILEREGVTQSAGRKGTFIKETGSVASMESIERQMINRFDEIIRFGMGQGLSTNDLIDLFNISFTQSKNNA